MSVKKLKYLFYCTLFLMNSCMDGDDATFSEAQYDFAYIEKFDQGISDWIGGFADYPDSLESELDLKIEYKELDNVFEEDNHALVLSGKNPHEDLFYYISRKFSDLDPNSVYQLSFSYEILMEAIGKNTVDETELYFKAGGLSVKPESTLDFSPVSENAAYNYLNADKGNDQVNGTDQIYYFGKIEEHLDQEKVILKGETDQISILVQTNANGEFWIIFGIDSNTPSELSFAFNTIIVFFQKQ